MMHAVRNVGLVVMTGIMVFGVAPAWSGNISGHYRERTVKGNTSTPYQEFYEWNAFLSPAGPGNTQTCRTGACLGTLTHDGRYLFPSVPDGQATIYCDQPNFFAAPKVNVIQVNPGSHTIDTAPNTCYHMAFGQNSASWGPSPWDWHGGVWRQTFVATGTQINRISIKLAASVPNIRMSLHRSNGGAVDTWPQVGPMRQVDASCSGCDVWAAWAHGELPTIPGETYAVAFSSLADPNIGFFVRRDALGPGYAQGTAYKDNTPQPFDLYAIIFSDNDGTVLTYQMESSNIGIATQWAGAWAQSFTARGAGLAAVGMFAQNNVDASWPADVSIHAFHPTTITGAQIGPTKRLLDAGWHGPGTGFGGVSFVPDEVPLVPGNQYVIVFSPFSVGEAGFVPMRRPGGNMLAGGTAYIGAGGAWDARDYDLSMTIMEYRGEDLPTPLPTATHTATPTHTPTPVLHRSMMEMR